MGAPKDIEGTLERLNLREPFPETVSEVWAEFGLLKQSGTSNSVELSLLLHQKSKRGTVTRIWEELKLWMRVLY